MTTEEWAVPEGPTEIRRLTVALADRYWPQREIYPTTDESQRVWLEWVIERVIEDVMMMQTGETPVEDVLGDPPGATGPSVPSEGASPV